MKNHKSILMIIAFFAFATSGALANNIGDSQPWKNQMKDYLSGLNIQNLEGETSKVMVDFILNDKGEILVLSTSESSLDETIKTRLNYKNLMDKDLEYNTKYTLPITIKK